MHFRDKVIAFIGPACAYALEPVARLAAYWNTPIITGMGDQVSPNANNAKCEINSGNHRQSRPKLRTIVPYAGLSSALLMTNQMRHVACAVCPI